MQVSDVGSLSRAGSLALSTFVKYPQRYRRQSVGRCSCCLRKGAGIKRMLIIISPPPTPPPLFSLSPEHILLWYNMYILCVCVCVCVCVLVCVCIVS